MHIQVQTLFKQVSFLFRTGLLHGVLKKVKLSPTFKFSQSDSGECKNLDPENHNLHEDNNRGDVISA